LPVSTSIPSKPPLTSASVPANPSASEPVSTTLLIKSPCKVSLPDSPSIDPVNAASTSNTSASEPPVRFSIPEKFSQLSEPASSALMVHVLAALGPVRVSVPAESLRLTLTFPCATPVALNRTVSVPPPVLMFTVVLFHRAIDSKAGGPPLLSETWIAGKLAGGGRGLGTLTSSIRMLSLPAPKLMFTTAMPVMPTGSKPVKLIVRPSMVTEPASAVAPGA